jgi:hypothetical protein
LLERIDLVECDARSLPPLASGPAAAVLDFAGRAGLELAPWQEHFVMSAYEKDEHGGWRLRSDRELLGVEPPADARRRPVPTRSPADFGGISAGEPIYDEVTEARPLYRGMRMADWPPATWPAPEPRRPWWRRWWSR